MKLAIPAPFLCRTATLALAAFCLLELPAISSAADKTNEVGVRLLEAELLLAKVTLLKVKCDPLVIAVSKTTLAHPDDALVILDAALTRHVHKLHRDDTATLPCTCARRIFLASLAAVPKRSSDLLDLAMELYPDCAPEFAEALRHFSASRTGEQSEGRPPGSADGAGMNTPLGDEISNPTNPDGGDGGFGVGFGPGFPGSPGFTGSGSGGGFALPPAPVTSVVNG